MMTVIVVYPVHSCVYDDLVLCNRSTLSCVYDAGELDNTIIIVTSDNGASGEGGLAGTHNEIRVINGLQTSVADNMVVSTVRGDTLRGRTLDATYRVLHSVSSIHHHQRRLYVCMYVCM